ncbi:MAG: carboxypeptidase regulatory-like domain-containing protein [Solirubrobacterales bacterium]|nr:carboxypeptidase regulatory-like domain-containing protein [Solirubrobacterales bacterium]
MIEVLVSALMVALIAAAVATALIAGATSVADQRARARAAALAQLDQERLKGLSAVQLTALAPQSNGACGQTRTVSLGGIQYSICSTANFLNSTGGSACGTTGAGAAAYYEVISSVNWSNNVRTPVVIESQITPPAGGTLLTMTEDQTGAPLPGVSVSATPVSGSGTTGSASGTTDSQGCAIFGGLSTGDYTLGLTDAGYVNPDDQPANPLNISSTVTSTGTATPSGGNPIKLGLAGTFDATFWGASASGQTSTSSGIYAAQPADAVSWYGSGSSDSMSAYECLLYSGASCPASSATSQATGLTVPSSGTQTLYPFAYGTYISPPVTYTGNYHIWAGPCRQMEPPSGVDSFTVTPGSTQAMAVQEPTMNLAVDFSNGSTTQVKPADLMLKFTSTSGTSCTDKWATPVSATAATAPNNALADPGQPFASTATSGSSESASTQTGYLSACADYTSGGTTYYGTLGSSGSPLQNTSFTGPAAQQTLTISNSFGNRGTCASKF